MSNDIEIRFLDHVAIRVENIEKSVEWYQNVLGLKKYQLPKWGNYPIFMLAGKSGVALFPANLEDPEVHMESKNRKIDHFAFNVTNENFEKAKRRYSELGLEFTFQDHHYFHSIYTLDPDGHKVELTTIKVDEDDFYN
ncbi:VOC family protein [Tenacibaculum xiamenense]|uniref:VOC family protein n=1 Tax=Tenacibaculum xiamenense TaxID=1261553 RepID=UPI00389593C2